jgi:outer membrane murein-binding lipoprotein Lpp
MASTREQILTLKQEINAKTGQLQRAQVIDATMSAEDIQTAKKTADRLQTTIDTLNSKVAELELPAKKKKEEAEKAKARAEGIVDYSELPEWTDPKLANEFKAAFPGSQFTKEIFQQGGVGTTAFVYNGQTVAPVGRKTSTGGYQTGAGMKTEVVSNISLANDVVQSYWNDKSVQDKVLSAMRASGKSNANLLDGFAQWQGVVQTAASVWQGGKGPMMTPMDILNMTIKNAGPQVSKDVQQYDKNVLSALVEGVYMKAAMRKPTAEELSARLSEMDKVIQAGVTTTTKGTTTTRTPSVSLTGLEEAVTKKVKATAPEGVETAKGIQFHDWMAQQMREGI